MVGRITVNDGKVVRPSQLIASVGPTTAMWQDNGATEAQGGGRGYMFVT